MACGCRRWTNYLSFDTVGPMKKLCHILIIHLISTVASNVVAETSPVVTKIDMPKRVLFVGNSFSYYNDGLHKHYGNLLRAAELRDKGNSRLRLLTYSGSGLWEHAAGLTSALSNEPWQVVVMHDYSNGPMAEPERFQSSTSELARIIRENGAKPVLLMTWAYGGEEKMTSSLDAAYTEQGNVLKAMVIPAGLAFARAGRETTINLFTPDLLRYENDKAVYKKTIKHPSLAGTYLTACVVFAAFTGQSPEGLRYDAGLATETATRLQRIAWQTTVDYYSR